MIKYYCTECGKKTLFRFLDCEEHGKNCTEIICTDCGVSLDNECKYCDRLEACEGDKCSCDCHK